MIEIKPCTAAEILSPENSWLIEEYAAESAIVGMPAPKPDFSLYSILESRGALSAFGAFDGQAMIGFACVVTQTLPHYSAAVSSPESLFVAGSYRKRGAGMKLLRAIENHAKHAGAVGLLISAPAGSQLEKVLPKAGYMHSNTVFFRGTNNE